MSRLFVLAFILQTGSACFAQAESDTSLVISKIYTLGEVKVSTVIDRSTVSSADMQKYNARDVGSALRALPSLILNENGARNEGTIYLRGFDIRSIPVFIDGIPVYVPYDGYVDLARFTVYDIARIDVAKGFSSLTYGANAIGGAINLIGMKPSGKMDVNAKLGSMSGNGYETRINLGSILGKAYLQAGFSVFERDFVPLSTDFDTMALETDHRRDNSSRKDIKGSFKIGYTPNTSDEYSLNYQYSHGSKGNPVYLGNDKNTRVRYWQWPYWDKQSLYYISRTALGRRSELKARGYLDRFKNKVSSFDDATYSTQERTSSFNSYYDDYTLGGNLEFTGNWNEENKLRISIHTKNDNHSEHNEGEPVRHFSDNTFSLGIENSYMPVTKLSFTSGISYNLRKSFRAEDYNSTANTISNYPRNLNDALNAQIAAYYLFSKVINISFNAAYKSRFATMKDRYSYRLGVTVPNPDLRSETALNLELASTINFGDMLTIRPELFYSRLYNTIQMVSNVQDDLSQMQNSGKAIFRGLDLSLVFQPVTDLNIYAAYSFIKRENISNRDILFTDVPDNKLFASVECTIAEKLLMNLSGEYASERYNSSDGTRVSPGYFLLNSQVSYSLSGYVEAEIGVNNLFDRNYTLQEGYPEIGRNFYAALYFDLHKRKE